MIERIHLYDIEIVEIDGDFKEIKRNEETLPGMLTNHSLYVGKRDGLLETSLTKELYNIIGAFEKTGVDPNEIKEGDIEEYGIEMFKALADVADEDKIMKVIYLSLIGANPRLEYTFEDFVLKYHGDLEDKMETYVSLISALASKDNDFKKEFEKKTSQKREKGEKK